MHLLVSLLNLFLASGLKFWAQISSIFLFILACRLPQFWLIFWNCNLHSCSAVRRPFFNTLRVAERADCHTTHRSVTPKHVPLSEAWFNSACLKWAARPGGSEAPEGLFFWVSSTPEWLRCAGSSSFPECTVKKSMECLCCSLTVSNVTTLLPHYPLNKPSSQCPSRVNTTEAERSLLTGNSESYVGRDINTMGCCFHRRDVRGKSHRERRWEMSDRTSFTFPSHLTLCTVNEDKNNAECSGTKSQWSKVKKRVGRKL